MMRILLVAADAGVRQGLQMRLALEPDVEVVGADIVSADSADAVLRLRPDLVLLDLDAPMDAYAEVAAVHAAAPNVGVILVSMLDDAATHERALASGAAALVGKRVPTEALLDTLRRVRAGQAGHPCARRAAEPEPEHEGTARRRRGGTTGGRDEDRG